VDVKEGTAGIVAEIEVHAGGVASGVPAAQRFWWVFQLEDGWQRRIRIFDNGSEALDAAGLRK
jgi:hypothetical protein